MKKFLLLFILSVPIILYSQTVHRLFVNKIDMPINNEGVMADVLVDGRDGGRIDGKTVIFSQGFYLGGLDANDSIWVNAVASASRIQDYLPGNVDSSALNSKYKLYIVNKNDSPFGTSWQEWKEAVNLGAEFYDGNNDSIYNPVDINTNGKWDSTEDAPPLIGQELAWCVYNDGMADSMRRFSNVLPKGLEIRQSIFAFKKDESNNQFEPLDYTIFTKYEIINTGKVSVSFDSVFLGLWSDTDNGDPYNDLVGSDTLVQSGYVYNQNNIDTDFGANPPTHFLTLLQGPVDYIPGVTFIDNNSNNTFEQGIDTPLDSAFNYKGLLGTEILPGAKNVSLSSYFHYQSSDVQVGDPNDEKEAYNYLNAKTRLGVIPDPCTWALGEVIGVDCNSINPKFLYSGGPVSRIGWLNKIATDQRQLAAVGPFKLEKDKPKTIIIGSIIAGGSSSQNSIDRGKGYAKQLLEFVQSNFSNFNITDVNEIKNIPANFSLSQNYPNPFNPSTKINYTLPYTANVKLQVYDVLGKLIVTIVNQEQNAGSYNIDLDLSKYSSGVYFYQLQTDNFIQTKKMLLMK